MGTGFGVASLVVALIGYGVPLVTIYVVWLSLVMASIAGLMGNKAFPLATFFACLLNLAVFSPLSWAVLMGENVGGESTLLNITLALFAAPIVALVVGAIMGKGKSAPSTMLDSN